MKRIFLSAMLMIAASTTLAATESQVAHCQLLDDAKQTIGLMEILASDNGDEGFLKFKFSITDSHSRSEFTDNVQDEGAAFLVSGASKLYVSLEGTKLDGKVGQIKAAAVFLENTNGIIKGKLRSDFIQTDLTCEKLR